MLPPIPLFVGKNMGTIETKGANPLAISQFPPVVRNLQNLSGKFIGTLETKGTNPHAISQFPRWLEILIILVENS